MSARRCSDCSINYPATVDHTVCDRCGERTDWIGDDQPHDDWLERVQEYDTKPVSELIHADAKTVQWRWGRLIRLGFAPADAEALAHRRDAELHDMERWLKAGATHEQALRIVASLDLAVEAEA